MKPIIGIVGRVRISEDNTSMISCFEDVRKCIIREGGIPILILPNQDIDYSETNKELTNEEIEDLKAVIDKCSGIVMPGTCRLYDYDRVIYEYALSKDMPILGICGGMQLIAINDKNLEEEKVLDYIESKIEHNNPEEKHVHKVRINKGTLLYDIIGEEEITVNSRHRQKVNSVNKLIISGVSEDDIIEAIEYSDKKFVIGVQWHPENLYDYGTASKKIFKRFIEACK